MRALRVDPDKRHIEEIDLLREETAYVCGWIHAECCVLDMIHGSLIGLSGGDALYLDDDAVMREEKPWQLGERVLMQGVGLVVGHTEDGEMTSSSTKLDELRRRVTWL